MSNVTVAEVGPFVIVTKSSVLLPCLRLIDELHRLLIVDYTCSTVSISYIPALSWTEFSMATLRLYVGTCMLTVSIFLTGGREPFVSNDSSSREYYPGGIPFPLMFTAAFVAEFVIDAKVNSEPVF